MGIARDLTVAVVGKLSTPNSVEKYGEKIGLLYRAVLKQVEEARREILANRRDSTIYQTEESFDLERDEE